MRRAPATIRRRPSGSRASTSATSCRETTRTRRRSAGAATEGLAKPCRLPDSGAKKKLEAEETMLRIVLAAALLLAAAQAGAQDDYPNRPPRILVPYPAGGVSDNVTRLFAQGLTEKLGKQF